MSGPEFNPADEHQPTKEEWTIYAQRDAIRLLKEALQMAFNTVECASLIAEGPDKGKEQGWYMMAKHAIAVADEITG